MKKVIIIENQYLIKAGLSYLIKEIPGLFLLKSFSGDEPRLISIILKNKPDILFINPTSLSYANHFLPRKLRSLGDMKLLAFIPDKQKKDYFPEYHGVLFLNDSKFTLENTIRKLVHPSSGKLNEQEMLSPRELTILRMIVKGFTHQEIADKLFLSIHTVNTHRKHINKKLGIKTVSGLSVYAIMNHLVELNELNVNW